MSCDIIIFPPSISELLKRYLSIKLFNIVMKKTAAAIFFGCVIAFSSFATTFEHSPNQYTTIKCNSSDSLDTCISAVHGSFANTLLTGSYLKWKDASLIFQSGNKVTAFQNGVSLGTFDVALLSATSSTFQYPYSLSKAYDHRIDLTAGGLNIRIQDYGFHSSTEAYVVVCVNNDCQTNPK